MALLHGVVQSLDISLTGGNEAENMLDGGVLSVRKVRKLTVQVLAENAQIIYALNESIEVFLLRLICCAVSC